MLFKKGANGFLFAVVVLFCVVPSRVKGMDSSDIFYDMFLKPMFKKTLGHVKMNTNKHGFFHQYDFSTFSFSVPLIYRLVSVDNVLAFFEGLAHWRGHEENLKSFFNGDKYGKYGSFFDETEMKYKFLEKYKNLTYSVSSSSCTTVLYSWYIQLRESNFFASYGWLYEYSKHVYRFDYYIFKYEQDLFEKMRSAYDLSHTQSKFINLADKIIHEKYPELKNNGNIPQGDIKPNLDRRYDSIVETYARKYITGKNRRQWINTLTDIYWELDENKRKTFEEDLKSKYIDYNARSNWEEANRSVSFCVNDFGVHAGISYLQNKIDPFYGFYFSMSLAAGIQYITCVNGVKIYDDKDEGNDKKSATIVASYINDGDRDLQEFDNNCFTFLKHQRGYKNLFSFFIKIRLEAGYGLLRFFISFKSLDLMGIKKALEPEMEFKLGEGKSAVRLDEYNEACYKISEDLVAKFNIKKEGFTRFLPKIIQFGFTLNL